MTPNFEEILLELSYRIPQGIVDLTNEEHLDELVTILEERGIYNSKAINTLREKAKKSPNVKSLRKNKVDTSKREKDLDNILKQKFLNPDTKRMVTVATALGYKKDFPKAYGIAKSKFTSAGFSEKDIDMVDVGPKDKETPAPKSNIFPTSGDKKNQTKKAGDIKVSDAEKRKEEPTTSSKSKGSFSNMVAGLPQNKNTEKQLQNTIQAQKSVLDTFDKLSKVKGNPHAAEHKQVKGLLEKLFNGEKLSSSEKKLAAQYVRVAEPTENNPNATKFYIAQEPGNFTTKAPKGRIRIYVGAKDSSNPVHGAFGKFVRANGMAELSPSTFGGKLSTANQTFVDESGKTRLLEGASSVKRGKDGVVESVKIGSLNIVRSNPDEPGISKRESKRRAKNNRTMDEYAEKIEAGDLDFIDMDKGVIPDSPENRVIVIKEAIAGMGMRFKALADKAIISDKETLTLIDRLTTFAKKDPNQNPQEWSKEFETILSDIANHEGEPSLKEGWANYAEIFVAIREMHDNGKGTQNGKCALLPQSTTLETVDVITISNGKGENRMVTLDGRSVKKGVGGASGLGSKARKSTYKNDPKGLIKKGIIELSESHGKPFEVKLDSSLKEHQRVNKEYQQYLKQKALELNVSPEFVKQIENDLKKGGKGESKVNSALAKVLLEREKAGLDIGPNIEAAIRLRLESRYMFTELAHEAYNENVDVQDFSNDSVLSQKEDRGGAKLVKEHRIFVDSSDGIDILAYVKPEFNIGFDLEGRSRNPGAGRMHNAPKRQ
jgi:hypothetical protein